MDRAFVLGIIFSGLGLLFLGRYCGALQGVEPRTTLSFSVFGYSLLAFLYSSTVGACARWSSELGILSRVLQSKSAVYLGTISYTMYLTHLPVYVLVQLVIIQLFGQYALEASRGLVLMWGILAAVLTILLATVSWRYFENPLLRVKERRFPMREGKRAAQPGMQTAAI